MRIRHEDKEGLRKRMSAKVDGEAAEARMRYVTLDPGMELVYKIKLEEAEMFLADPEGETNIPWWETPHLHSEAQAFGETREQIALSIFQSSVEWAQLSAHIEGLRTKAKYEINIAENVEDIKSAANVQWGV